jgi:hypothetical protein
MPEITPNPEGYRPSIEYSKSFVQLHPNNCAVKERTGDGVYVGECWSALKDGTTCPRHGKVREQPLPTCNRCNTSMLYGRCTNISCPYSDNPQEIPYDDLTSGQLIPQMGFRAIQKHPQASSISDDDLCGQCAFLMYCPGHNSLCRQATDSGFPGQRNDNSYIASCKQFTRTSTMVEMAK